jgi:hypothetical protein
MRGAAIHAGSQTTATAAAAAKNTTCSNKGSASGYCDP